MAIEPLAPVIDYKRIVTGNIKYYPDDLKVNIFPYWYKGILNGKRNSDKPLPDLKDMTSIVSADDILDLITFRKLLGSYYAANSNFSFDNKFKQIFRYTIDSLFTSDTFNDPYLSKFREYYNAYEVDDIVAKRLAARFILPKRNKDTVEEECCTVTPEPQKELWLINNFTTKIDGGTNDNAAWALPFKTEDNTPYTIYTVKDGNLVIILEQDFFIRLDDRADFKKFISESLKAAYGICSIPVVSRSDLFTAYIDLLE